MSKIFRFNEYAVIAFFLCIATQAALAQEGFIDCRKFGNNIVIKIDGDPSDWPINLYGDPAELPDIDPAENIGNNATSNAVNQVPLKTGDHFVYNSKKVLISSAASLDTEGEGDFEATTYIGWDDTGFYLLNVAKDSYISWDDGYSGTRDASNLPGFTNDGIEMWFDNDNDRLPPNINNDQTSQFDLQTAFNIDAAIMKEEFDSEAIMANGLPQDFAIFRSALNTDDAKEGEILAKVERAVKLDSNPMLEHKAYVQEIKFPWGVFPSFDKGEPIGFNINWIDFDATNFQLMRWLQANESDVQYFREMRFTSNNPLGEAALLPEWSIY